MSDTLHPLRPTVDAHPLLDPRMLAVRWPVPPGALAAPPWLDALCALDADTPFSAPDAAHVTRVRDLLRHGGFKPAGRSKPCSEYIRAAAAEGRFPRIDPMVDLTNAAALHGALPVSTVDADRLVGPLAIRIAEAGSSYVFNASGQTLDTGGLLCLFDADGAVANAVKDSQRTKTTPDTTRTLTIVWGTSALPGRAEAVLRWMAERVRALGGEVEAL
jgi:DNA/RNA-binding domain of Phe-tRNA-synthetase-like protein